MKFTKLCLFLASLVTLAIGSSSSALAQVTLPSTTFQVTASVAANCKITASPLKFGAYDPIGINKSTALTAKSALTLTCTQGAKVNIGLDAGLNSGGTLNRAMAGGTPASPLAYSLLQPDLSTPWGNVTGTWYAYTASDDTATDVAVNGVIPAGQHVSPGNYADTVTATVNF